MHTIFLSYRRQDSADICDRLSDHLRRRYGNSRVFRDTTAILAGSTFPQAIQQALDDCRVMLVVIGPGWLDARDEQGRRRLDDPQDWVRREVATGLREGKRVIPVLVRGARMPTIGELPEDMRELAQYPPLVIRSGPAFLGDVDGVYRVIGRAARGGPPHLGLLVCGAGTLLVLLALMLVVTVPTLADTEAFVVQANEHLVEVAIALEVLRVIATRRWVWVLVPIASAVLEVASASAGIFALIIILFTLCVLPPVMGTLGPPASARPLGAREGWQSLRSRGLGVATIAASMLALIGTTVLAFAGTLGLWQVFGSASAQAFSEFATLSFGPLLLAWCLVLVGFVLARQWVASVLWLLVAATYIPAVVLMVHANMYPLFLTTCAIVPLGIGWWVVRQPAVHLHAMPPVAALAPVAHL